MTNSEKPRILIIYTGGTIGMVETADGLQPFDFSHLMDNVPKVGQLGYQIDSVQFSQPIDSSNMSPAYWNMIVKDIADRYDQYDGFVVLHGTDTMAYTASALAFMLRNLRKPVVITGSQLPIGDTREDGTENLIAALQVAAAKDDNGDPMIQEVVISFQDYIVRGCRSTKFTSTGFHAFKSFNYPVLGTIDLHIEYAKPYLLRHQTAEPLNPFYSLDPSVLVMWLFPGISESVVKAQLATPGIKAVVLRTFGAGNAPTEQWFLDALSDAVGRGLIIYNVTQCQNGGDEQKRYYTGDMLAKAGVISGYDITVEAAVTKLMYLLGAGLTSDQIKEYLGISIVGEITVG
ncbi:MAG: asparaginase [Muribaculaceae bacterium]|nr:asparaginase [Muribaculaceae bacterium]MDE5929910.1 asparaginase [Muribaculaceae bacterium]